MFLYKNLIILNLINSDLIKKLDYKSINLSFFEKLIIPIIFFLPLKDEIDFIKDFKFSHLTIYLKFFIFFFPKRVRLIQILLKNKISRKYDYIQKKMIS